VVSENARRLREEKRLTLDEAARLTGVSRSMLAQIEKGDVNPTISMVWKIANGYKVSFTSLVEPARERPVLLRGDDAPILEEDGGRYRNCPAFPFDGERGFETYRIVMLPGGALEAQPHLPGRRRSACRGRPTGSGPATPCASRRTSPTATGTRGRRRLNSVC